MPRIAPILAALILTAAPALADVSTFDLPRLTWPTGTTTVAPATTVSTANGR